MIALGILAAIGLVVCLLGHGLAQIGGAALFGLCMFALLGGRK